MKTAKLIIVGSVVLGLTACPNRQSNVRLVYVPSPPPAASKADAQGDVMVIQKPAPAEPVVAEAKPQRPPEPVLKPPPEPVLPVVRKEAAAPSAATPQPAPADAPPLEPATSLQQQASTQRRVSALQRNLQTRIRRLVQTNLAAAERKTLEDARTFVAQSESALKKGDLAQASNLAEKAGLLIQAVEKNH